MWQALAIWLFALAVLLVCAAGPAIILWWCLIGVWPWQF